MSRDVRNAIVAVLRSVEGVGRVHDRQRYAARQADFRDLYMEEGCVKGWHVRLVSRAERQDAIGRYTVIVRWAIEGYRGFDDDMESEIEFADLVDKIAEAFRADNTLGGVVLDTAAPGGGEDGFQVDVIEPVMFAGILCHGATCHLTTRSLL